MVDFNSVLSAARQLSEVERLRLIDALWSTVPMDSFVPLHEEWGPELERRMAAIQSRSSGTIAWEQIRDAALLRVASGQ